MHDISKNLVDQIDVILLDFFKAFTESFNKVPQQHLLHKLQYYRVARKTLSLSQIESFMTGRIQQVAVQGTLSSSAAVLFGVPQGMVLCPLFYLVQSYIPVLDLLQLTTFCIDYRRIKDQHDQAQLEEDLDSLRDWEHTWQMEFNPSKNTASSPSSKTSYFLHGQTLETSRQITRCCYIHAQKSEMEKSSTMKMIDPPRNALQNQQQPCRYTPSQLHPSV